MKDDQVYLLHIAEAIATIEEYVATGRAAFYSQKMIQDAVIRNLEIIGEVTKNISSATRQTAPSIPWQKMAGLRDILIHDYFEQHNKSVPFFAGPLFRSPFSVSRC